ncbi:alpha/beta fold hydrolase [Streptomyces zagrosensis]|uniref:Pimeloyl-ACP methyl ester carboxylesterase n=1 Tax=Streptomyces zagrosensis TaxID=1042984 RepID=A0A7W9Q549_9ACTN|nr:alpha/beta hydrolase [Streptomyces zagrosensis]MBB5933549.1 pimeloyl-ACP methyl ester carboxylesterase [Streptomyces zagrosensis]
MRLHTREWGTGDRLALLIHGMMSDHRTWRRVGPALADSGYRVIAVDLRGHGMSERADEYTVPLFAADLVENLPVGAELAIGHSLGGLSLSLAVDRLRPQRAIYSDPAWALRSGKRPVDADMFVRLREATRSVIAYFNPLWDEGDVDAELAGIAAWDPATAYSVSGENAIDWIPERPLVPSLVQAADPSRLLSGELKDRLSEQGFAVHTLKKAGHSIHRDDFDGFMESVLGWVRGEIRGEAPVGPG